MSDDEALPKLWVLKDRVQTLRDLLPDPTEVEDEQGSQYRVELETLDELLGVWEEMILDPLGDKDINKRFLSTFEKEHGRVISYSAGVFRHAIALAQSPVTKPRGSTELIELLAAAGMGYSEAILECYRSGRVDTDVWLGLSVESEIRVRRFPLRIREIHNLARVDQAVSKAEAAVESTRRAAGEAGSLKLFEHFENYRKSERRAAESLRTIAVVLVIATVVILALLPHVGLTLADVLQRALIAVPAFGLAGYLAAESGRHRRTSQWAATLKVQLLSVDAYVQSLGPEAEAQIRQLLAMRAFGDLPTAAGGTGNSEDQPLQIGTQGIIDKVVEQLKPKAGS